MLNVRPQLLLHLPMGEQWIWLLLIVIILFGGKKIPELARGIGKGIREFNHAKDGIKSEIEAGIKDKEKVQTPETTAGTVNNA
jgi:sec-independent protein translocase protein TatA